MENNGFNYKYSAPTEKERREIESIRRQYTASAVDEEDKFSRLRRLHGDIISAAMAASITVGVVGLLIFGSGLALVLEFSEFIFGCILSAVGLLPMLSAYPLYKAILKSKKKKHSAEILRLSEELLGNS